MADATAYPPRCRSTMGRIAARREACRPARKLDDPRLWKWVFEKIPEGYTPEQVARGIVETLQDLPAS